MNTITQDALNQIDNRERLFSFLRDYLGWQVQPEDPFTYQVYIDSERMRTRVNVTRLVPFSAADPFLIILAEFEGELRRTDLREILRQLRAQIRSRAAYEGRTIEEILFLCTVDNYQGIRFAHFVEPEQGLPRLQSFGWNRGDRDIRTLCEFNLPALRMPDRHPNGDYDWASGRTQWLAAWNVEKFTNDFFQEYHRLFHEAHQQITGLNGEAKWFFTQKLFNRLLFIRFLEKKGWLRINQRQNYLNALLEEYQNPQDRSVPHNFYHERLKLLFFSGLNNPQQRNQMAINRGGLLRTLIGDVPYLNGGLFEQEPDDQNDAVSVPDEAVEPILTNLLYRYNFTVTESTPLDIEVAVDPEMLGKVFEELVTGRHESGSYYTPRPVVAFMCREALKGYLQTKTTELPDAIAQFVEQYDAGGLRDPEKVLAALKSVRVCDPACGSGAYLLGMLHELLDLRQALFATHRLDAHTIYERKMEIIQNNLYGVDSNAFAVNIARLRLWLSLVVDDTRNPLDDFEIDVSLPNLDFKIEVGDSLLAPDPQGGQQPDLYRQQKIEEFEQLKGEYMRAHTDEQKRMLRQQIDTLREEIRQWAHPDGNILGFDWRVEFAEVFKDGGFDIVLMNPPYVRQERIENKDALLKRYPAVAEGRSDLYVYFYARALQLLKPGGMHVFVCSNSWLDVGFGGTLQKYLLTNAHILAIYDSAVERQFASADVNTIISILRKGRPNDATETRFIRLEGAFDQAIADPTLQRVITRTRAELWQEGLDENSHYTGNKWGGKYLRAPDIFWTILEKGKDKLVPLGDIAEVRFGIKTGANEFFYLEPTGKPAPKGYLHVRNGVGWEGEIEEEFLKPVIKSPRECRSIVIKPEDLRYKIFMCHKDKRDLQGTAALDYIRWGESQGYHQRPSCRGRQRWWDVGMRNYADLLWVETMYEAFRVYKNEPSVYESDKFYGIAPSVASTGLSISLNSSPVLLFKLLSGFASLGQGGLKTAVYEVKNFQIPHPALIEVDRSLATTFFRREIGVILDEIHQPDRRALDEVVFDVLGLTAGEREAVYEAVVNLVQARLDKARSV